MKKWILPVMFLIVISTGCSKDAEPIVTSVGELIDSGNPAADGAGYFIRLDNNEEFKPDQLPDSLQVAGIRTRVEVRYQLTNKTYKTSCGTCPGLPVGHIIDIRKI